MLPDAPLPAAGPDGVVAGGVATMDVVGGAVGTRVATDGAGDTVGSADAAAVPAEVGTPVVEVSAS